MTIRSPMFRSCPPRFLSLLWVPCMAISLSGCAVIAVADAAVTVAATTVKVGATVVETAVDVTAAGVKAVAGSGDANDEAAKPAP